jgi:hypothetical protein
MAGDEDDVDDDGYGELGGRHPLRRVDEGKEDSGVSLPGIKALFGVAGEIVWRFCKPLRTSHAVTNR